MHPAWSRSTAAGLLAACRGPFRLRRCATPKEAFDTEVLIDVWPMNALPIAEQLPVLALRCGGPQKTRVPHERNRDSSAVREPNLEFIVSYADILSEWDVSCRTSHARPPRTLHGVYPL